jgi:hypothetical protein
MGPKSICSDTGVSFNACKEDKYIYLGPLCDLILSLDYDYHSGENHATQTGQRAFDEKSILDLIRSYTPDLDKKIEEQISKTQLEIENSLVRARGNHLLMQEAKYTLMNNIEIMRQYQIQRAINKGVYYAGIDVLASIVKQRHIKHISTTMEPKLLHVLYSLQVALRSLQPLIDSQMDIFEKQEHLVVELKILG